MFSILSRRCPLLATSLSVLFCLLSMLISDSRFDLVWFRLSCDHGRIRSGSVNVRKQQHQQQQQLLNPGSVAHSPNIRWARSSPSVPVFAEIVRFASVSRRGGKLYPSCHGVVEEDVDVDFDHSREPSGIRSNVAISMVAPSLAAIPFGRASPAGGRGTAASSSLRGAPMNEIPSLPVHSSSDTPVGLLSLRPLQHPPRSTRLEKWSALARWLNR